MRSAAAPPPALFGPGPGRGEWWVSHRRPPPPPPAFLRGLILEEKSQEEKNPKIIKM